MTHRGNGWRGRAWILGLLILVGCCASGAVRAANLVPSLLGPTNAVTAGGRATVSLVYLNADGEVGAARFPRTLSGRLVPLGASGASSVSVTLTRTASAGGVDRAAGDDLVEIGAGTFARRAYDLEVPGTLLGTVGLEVEAVPGPGVVLVVKRAGDVAAAGGDGAAGRSAGGRSLLTEGQQASKPYSPEQFFREHFHGYEPVYFIAGSEIPNAKFQISLRYQLLSNDGALARHAPFLKGLSVAYTQTSLWDLNSPSAPFFDSSYKPEMLYVYERVDGGKWADWVRLDLQGGLQHESNGKAGFDSRSLNIGYVRPRLTLGRPDGFQFTIQPRVWGYVGDLNDNPDLKDYRGYGDLRLTAGWARGAQLSATGRLGDDWGNGAVQLDLTYPMMRLLSGSFSVYLHAQYFNGYGESLLEYNERSDAFRIGFGLYR